MVVKVAMPQQFKLKVVTQSERAAVSKSERGSLHWRF